MTKNYSKPGAGISGGVCGIAPREKCTALAGVVCHSPYNFFAKCLLGRAGTSACPRRLAPRVLRVRGFLQNDFEETLQDLEGIVTSFAQYSDMSKLEEISENVQSVNERIDMSVKAAKLYNNRESLFGKPVTDYSRVQKLVKVRENKTLGNKTTPYAQQTYQGRVSRCVD